MATIRFISGEAALGNFIEGIRQQAVDRLQVSGYNATRRLTNSLKTDVSKTGTGGITAELSGLGHWKFVGNGRGPGKRPPLPPLIRWAKAKGLAGTDAQAVSIASRIARNIAQEGTLDHQLGGINVFSQIITENQPQIEDVVSAFLSDFREPIAQQFRNTFNAA